MELIASVSRERLLYIFNSDGDIIARVPLPLIGKSGNVPKLISSRNDNNFAVYHNQTILRWAYHPPDCSLEPLPAVVTAHGHIHCMSFSHDSCRIISGHNQGCMWS